MVLRARQPVLSATLFVFLVFQCFLEGVAGTIVDTNDYGNLTNRFHNQVMHLCFMWWGNVLDKGYTEAHQTGLDDALKVLQQKYPKTTFKTHIQSNAAQSTNMQDQLDRMMGNNCSFLYAPYIDVLPMDMAIRLANSYPNTQILIGTLVAYREDLPRNIICAEPLCDKDWYLAGQLAGYEVDGDCIGMIIPWKNLSTYIPYAFAKGVRHINKDIEIILVPTASWHDAAKDKAISKLLLENASCSIVLSTTDEPIINNLAATFNKRSIGWHYDRKKQFGESVIMSVLRTFDAEFFHIIEDFMFGVRRHSFQTFGCDHTEASSMVPESTWDKIVKADREYPGREVIWDVPIIDHNGKQVAPAMRNDVRQILKLNDIANIVTLSPDFVLPETCPAGTYVSITTRPLIVNCTRCPAGSYSTSTGSPRCEKCRFGYISSEDRTECSAINIIIIVIVAAGLVVLIVLGILIYAFCFRKNQSEADVEATMHKESVTGTYDHQKAMHSSFDFPMEASVEALPLGNTHSVTNQELLLPEMKKKAPVEDLQLPESEPSPILPSISLVQSSLVAEREHRRSMVESKLYYIGAQMPATTIGCSMYKVVLHNGTTIAMKEMHGPPESVDDMLPITRLPLHPSIADHYYVEYSPETGTTRLFLEYIPDSPLKAIIAEVCQPLAGITARTFAVQLVDALDFLHRHNIAHRNLSTSTARVDSSGRLKITDFVSAKHVEKGNTDSLTIVTSPENSPPEMLTGKGLLEDAFEQATKADIWSLGLLLTETMNRGRGPWPITVQSVYETARFLTSDEPLEIPAHIEGQARAFLECCLKRDPARRSSAAELKHHAWLSETNDSSILSHSTLLNSNANLSSASSQLTLGQTIGTGAFGTVYEGKVIETGEAVAVKSISYDTRDMAETGKMKKVMKEISVMKELDHENIVRYKFLEKTPVGTHNHQTIYIVMEYVAGGTLRQVIVDKGKISEDDARYYTRDILRGLSYLHGRGVTHRDIKPSNCLLTTNEPPPNTLLKLADFGTATNANAAETVTLAMQGTLLYMAPEIIREERPTPAADIWSLGASVMEMITGEYPWTHVIGSTNNFAIISYVASNEALKLPDGLSPTLQNFLQHALEREPEKRWSAEDLLKHPWLESVA